MYFGSTLRIIDWRELIKSTEAIAVALVLCSEIFKICVAFSKKKSDQSPTRQKKQI